MARKEFDVEVLDDGKISVSMGDMGGESHVNADQFLKVLQELMGAKAEIRSTKASHQHHGHSHGKGDQHHHH